MGGWLDQLKLMCGGIVAAALLAAVGLQFSVTPTYSLITRPTPTPTPAPYTFNDPRLSTRLATFAQAQAAATFKILRPVAGVERDPAAVMLYEAGKEVVSVRQTYTVTPTTSTSPGNLWLTQSPGGNLFAQSGFQRQAVTNTVTLVMADGRQQPATLSRNNFGTTLSWTDAHGFFSLRANGADFNVDRLVEIAVSLR